MILLPRSNFFPWCSSVETFAQMVGCLQIPKEIFPEYITHTHALIHKDYAHMPIFLHWDIYFILRYILYSSTAGSLHKSLSTPSLRSYQNIKLQKAWGPQYSTISPLCPFSSPAYYYFLASPLKTNKPMQDFPLPVLATSNAPSLSSLYLHHFLGVPSQMANLPWSLSWWFSQPDLSSYLWATRVPCLHLAHCT